MKRKYQGIFSVGALSVMLVLVGLYAASGMWRRGYTASGPAQAPLVDSWMPSQDQIDAVRRLSSALASLAVPHDPVSVSAPLTLFGQRSAPSWQLGPGGDDPESDADPHGLSLTVMAGPLRYCVVNGAFVAEGGKLKDGASVLKVENQRVLIARGKKLQWVYLKDDSMAIEPHNASSDAREKGSS